MKNWMISLGMLLALGVGCGEQGFDCRDICSTTQSCMSIDIDVSDCSARCSNFAATSQAAENQVEACNECLDQTACTATGTTCSGPCSFVAVIPD